MGRRSLRSSCALCVVSLVVAGCGGAAKKARAPTPSPEQRIALAVVGIETRIGANDARSSGIVIDPARGLVVTAAHTVWGARELKISTAFGVLHGRIVARAPCDDLAVLAVSPGIPGLATLPAAPGSAPARGQLLRSLGRRRTADSAGAMA